jgi:hypothetical protein
MRILTLLLFSILSLGVSAQTVTVATTNVYSLRYFDGGQYTNNIFICDFGEVINVDDNFQGVDIGAYQSPKHFMENRTIMTFDLRGIPLTVSNKPISKVTMVVPLQNQDNGIPNGVIDIFSFYNVSQASTNLWLAGTYYKSFPDSPDLQNVDVTSLVKSAKNGGYTTLNLRMSTSMTNTSCVFVSPAWHTNKTSLIVNYSPVVIPEQPTNMRFASF